MNYDIELCTGWNEVALLGINNICVSETTHYSIEMNTKVIEEYKLNETIITTNKKCSGLFFLCRQFMENRSHLDGSRINELYGRAEKNGELAPSDATMFFVESSKINETIRKWENSSSNDKYLCAYSNYGFLFLQFSAE